GVREEARGELGDLGEGAADGVWIRAGGPGSHAGRAERARGVRRHPLQRGSKLECLQHGGSDPSRNTHTIAANCSRAIWLASLPSARPLNFGMTCPMSPPRSFAPAAIASRTACRISSESTAARRNASSNFTPPRLRPARARPPPAPYCP